MKPQALAESAQTLFLNADLKLLFQFTPECEYHTCPVTFLLGLGTPCFGPQSCVP